jgi:hypothetical protein
MNKLRGLAKAWLLSSGLSVVPNLVNSRRRRNYRAWSGRRSGSDKKAGTSPISFLGAEHDAHELLVEGVAITVPNQLGITGELARRISLQGVEKEFRRDIGTPIQKQTIFSFTRYAEDLHYLVTASATKRKSHTKYKCFMLNVGPPYVEDYFSPMKHNLKSQTAASTRRGPLGEALRETRRLGTEANVAKH